MVTGVMAGKVERNHKGKKRFAKASFSTKQHISVRVGRPGSDHGLVGMEEGTWWAGFLSFFFLLVLVCLRRTSTKAERAGCIVRRFVRVSRYLPSCQDICTFPPSLPTLPHVVERGLEVGRGLGRSD